MEEQLVGLSRRCFWLNMLTDSEFFEAAVKQLTSRYFSKQAVISRHLDSPFQFCP